MQPGKIGALPNIAIVAAPRFNGAPSIDVR